MLTVISPKTEYTLNPICVPCEGIRFSWQGLTDERNAKQAAYRITVKSEKEEVWDSGKIYGADTAGILYGGKPLRPRTCYTWQVKIWTETGIESDFCKPQTFETCPSNEEWESAAWIGADTEGLPLLRKCVTLEDKKIIKARAYASGLGNYLLTLNGQPLSKELLTPMVTRYHKRYFYNAYDPAPLLCEKNALFGVTLGRGYYAMRGNGVDWQKDKWANAPWADSPKFKLLVFITYEDGSEQKIITDESWKCTESPLRVDEAYYGEEHDFRMQTDGWEKTEYDDSAWKGVLRLSPPLGKAEIQLAESCAVTETLPLKLLSQKENEYLFDTERMISGWIKLTLSGRCGDEVEVSYSEWLDEKGEFSQKGLLGEWELQGKKRQGQTDYFTLRGDREETLAPLFLYKSFRYARIRVKGEAKLLSANAEVVRADLAQIGDFSCSDQRLNELDFACKNTLRNNLHSYPSDTPVYENLGYLADGWLTQEIAHFHLDSVKFYEKWARDIFDQAKEDGYIEQTAPMWDEDKENAPEWSLGAVIVPYQIYRATGDKKLLLEGYDTAKRVFAYQVRQTRGYIATSMWGDSSPTHSPIKEISASAFLYHAANLLAESAKMQGLTQEYAEFCECAERIKTAFNNRFYDEALGYYREVKSTRFALNAQILPYALGLADESQRKALTRAVTNYAHNLDCGILSAKYLFPVLTDMGLGDRLYEWVTATNLPSWGYWLSSGDKSLWEQLIENTRSRNHHMFGTADEWLYKRLAGLEPVSASRLRIRPYFTKKLEWAQAKTATVNGEASCKWKRTDGGLLIDITIPFNVTACVHLPAHEGKLYENGAPVEPTDGEYLLELGSGGCSFILR